MAIPKLAAPRARTDEPVTDIDIWHVINQADDRLVADEVMHGGKSGAFAYNFKIAGEPVSGVSVVGARHLARKYGGLKHRLIASVEKKGSLFKSVAYPAEGTPMQVSANYVTELADEPDYYECLVEIEDIKTGNRVQTQFTEMRYGKRKGDGSAFERPNYATIAQSKAYRNGVLAVVPQDVQQVFLAECLKLGKAQVLSSPLDEARDRILQFAAAKGIRMDRRVVFELGMSEIAGMRDAVAAGGVDAFRKAAEAVGAAGDELPQIELQPGAPFDAQTGEVGAQVAAEPAAKVDAKPQVAPGVVPKLFGAEG